MRQCGHRSTGSHSSEAFRGALVLVYTYCQISDLGSDSDKQQQQRIVRPFTNFLSLHYFRMNVGIHVGIWQARHGAMAGSIGCCQDIGLGHCRARFLTHLLARSQHFLPQHFTYYSIIAAILYRAGSFWSCRYNQPRSRQCNAMLNLCRIKGYVHFSRDCIYNTGCCARRR